MTLPTDEGTVAPVEQRQATYFDGITSRKRQVTLHFGTGLDLVEDGTVIATWPYGSLRRVDSPPTVLRLHCLAALPLARLDVADAAAIEAVAARSPSLDVGRSGRGYTGRIVFWSLAAVCSIVAMAVYGIPYAADRLAPLVPQALERRIGEAVDVNVRFIFKGKVCDQGEGPAIFAKLVDKLRVAGGVDLPLDAQVLSHPLPNAFALPGGKVYLMDGLLQKARNPDEIAGVLAHELGHVQHRDGLRRLIQTGGTSFLIGLLFGDVFGAGAVIFATQTLLNASYSREAEQRADAFTVTVMHKLGRSPRPMGEFLLRVTDSQGEILGKRKGNAGDSDSDTPRQKGAVDMSSKKEGAARSPGGKGFTLFDSHPLTEDRLAAMTKNEPPVTGPELLSAEEWKALKAVCKS